jgi:hypothetical protein
MLTSVADLEFRLLESMSREQMLAVLSQRQDLLPPAMSADWLSRQSMSALRMLLLAAKLLDAVRQMDRRAASGRDHRSGL